MKKLYFLLFTFLITSLSFGQDMVITGAFDGPLTGGTPKVVEIYVINNISDLSTFGFGSANNGDGSDGEELTFTGTANAGDFIYITDSEVNFQTYFGFAADYVSGSASVNGDDALELFSGGVVIDTFGDINTDGSGQPWDYLDGWAYRVSSTGPDGATFALGNWSFSGINAVDGCSDNASCSSSFPLGTFTYGGTPCGISLGTAVYACATNTIGDNNDGVTVEIPYTGLDATITSVTTTSGGTVAGDNPALVTDGTITITGLFEGDSWDITVNGGNCDALSTSGSVPAAECDVNVCYDLSGETYSFEIVNIAVNSQNDVWTNSNGTYSINGFCGGGCSEATNGWLVFGPIDMQGASDFSLIFDATEGFDGSELNIQYTNDYSSLCPDTSSWTSLSVISDDAAGSFNIDLSGAQGNDVFFGIQYSDSDGSYSSWSLSNVELSANGQCPTLGTIPTSACATCDINLQTENYVCLTNTEGDNNDGVTVEVPYTGSETSGGVLSTTSGGVISGDISVADSTITITGLNEGDSWDVIITGGDCDSTSVSGTIPASNCDPVFLVINEINADPSNNANGEGDANGDGVAQFNDDEFVEIYNTSADPIDLSGFVLADSQDRHFFPAGTILPGESFITVFGGGTPSGVPGIVQVATEGSVGLSNSGDTVRLKNSLGIILIEETYSGAGNNQSIARDPNFTGPFVQHSTIGGSGFLFSPGLANDDASLSTNSVEINKISLYPNPSNTGYVNITSINNGVINAKVFDILGKKVIDASIENNRLDVNQLKTGIYIIKMTQGTNSTTKKLVIE